MAKLIKAKLPTLCFSPFNGVHRSTFDSKLQMSVLSWKIAFPLQLMADLKEMEKGSRMEGRGSRVVAHKLRMKEKANREGIDEEREREEAREKHL